MHNNFRATRCGKLFLRKLLVQQSEKIYFLLCIHLKEICEQGEMQ